MPNKIFEALFEKNIQFSVVISAPSAAAVQLWLDEYADASGEMEEMMKEMEWSGQMINDVSDFELKELVETKIPDADNYGARITVNEKGEEIEDDHNS